ncbi:MAG: transporter substrate-binding domain-containing protein, partial [Oscillospiraceae bacterium]|nr:transporter substrate-binding domain-containing protein [Oscillospiraceae bacterium]
MRKPPIRSACALLLVICMIIMIISVFAGCERLNPAQSADSNNIASPFGSFRDIPGVTAAEIEEIDGLLTQYGSFVYGMPLSTEAFRNENGEVSGYSALLCEWLSDFFGIPFKPELFEWLDLLDGLETGEISFSGELTATEERESLYFMTEAIASRPLKYFLLESGRTPEEIAAERPVLCGFIESTSTIDTVASELEPGSFEIVLLRDVSLVHGALLSGEIDAFYYSGTAEANFAEYDDVVARDFYPLIYRPVSLATRDKDLAAVISVTEKALEDGAMRLLSDFYIQGERDYLKYKLFSRFTNEERDYINSNPVIPMGVDPGNYPGCFYNRREKEWQGIFPDMLDEVSALTGLTFERVNDENTEWPEIYRMLINGEIALVPELTRTAEREGRFLWPETAEMTDYYALISKSDYRDIRINEILYVKVGLAKDTAYTEIFRKWFPNHINTVEYASMEDAFDALRAGDVEMVMANRNRLLYLTNYLELPGYKANIVFDLALDIKIGLNKDEAVLMSVLDKTLKLTDTAGISDNWIRKTYDYRTKLAQARLPYLIGAVILSLCVMTLTLLLFRGKRNESIRLERQVKARTSELTGLRGDLEDALDAAHAASRSKSVFLANMSHELRTPLNVIIGLTDLTLEETGLPVSVKTNLRSVSNAGGTLLSIVNDILDISKIESGKLTLNPSPYSLPDLLNDTVMMVTTYIGEKPIDFKLHIREDLPSVLQGDELRVKQIMTNLLSNAVKYTPEGTVELSVDCRRDGDDAWLDITVADTGIGIREEDKEYLFTDYYQADAQTNRNTEGTGLGLSITRKMSEMMGGSV